MEGANTTLHSAASGELSSDGQCSSVCTASLRFWICAIPIVEETGQGPLDRMVPTIVESSSNSNDIHDEQALMSFTAQGKCTVELKLCSAVLLSQLLSLSSKLRYLSHQ